MSDHDSAIMRLQRAGISNARAAEELYQAAWEAAAVMWETSTEADSLEVTNLLAEFLERCARTIGVAAGDGEAEAVTHSVSDCHRSCAW